MHICNSIVTKRVYVRVHVRLSICHTTDYKCVSACHLRQKGCKGQQGGLQRGSHDTFNEM